MSDQQEQMLAKIQALLAKAEATSFPEEAKSFTAKAQELMARWAIDEAMLRSTRQADRTEVGVSEIWIPANEFRGPKISLLSWIAGVNDCRIVLFRQRYVTRPGEDKPRRMVRAEVFGFDSDRRFVETLYTSLLLQSEQELLRPETLEACRQACPQGGHRIAWRNSFMKGYAAAIYYRLRRAKEAAKTQAAQQYGSSMALVLVGKDQQVQRYLDERYGKLGQASRSSAGESHFGATQLGREAAGRADLGSPKVGTSSTTRQLNSTNS